MILKFAGHLVLVVWLARRKGRQIYAFWFSLWFALRNDTHAISHALLRRHTHTLSLTHAHFAAASFNRGLQKSDFEIFFFGLKNLTYKNRQRSTIINFILEKTIVTEKYPFFITKFRQIRKTMAKSDKFVQYLPDWKLIPPQKVLPQKFDANKSGWIASPSILFRPLYVNCNRLWVRVRECVSLCVCTYERVCVCERESVCMCVGIGASDFVNENSVGFSKLSLSVIYVEHKWSNYIFQ